MSNHIPKKCGFLPMYVSKTSESLLTVARSKVIKHFALAVFECHWLNQWRTQDFFSGGFQQIQLRTEDRENGDLGAVAP